MEGLDVKQVKAEKQAELMELSDKFASAALSLNKDLSPAQIQKHLINYKDKPEKAIEEINRVE